MLTDKELENIANNFIKEKQNRNNIELLLIKEETIKKSYGLIFFYTSKEAYENKNINIGLIGNAPFLVEKGTGKIIVFGTSYSEDYYIKEYEEGRWE